MRRLLLSTFLLFGSGNALAAADFADGILTLERVDAPGLGAYAISMNLVVGDRFTLSTATEITPPAETTAYDAWFSSSTNQLNIPSVLAAGDAYHVILQYDAVAGDFGLLSFVPLAGDGYGKNRSNTDSGLAVNIAPFAAWTPGWVLIDLFPKTQAWVSNLCDSSEWNSGPPLALDDAGWLTELPSGVCADTSVLSSQAGHYPDGTYVLLWEGEGTISARWDVEPEVSSASATVTEANNLKRMTFEVFANNQSDLGIGLSVSSLDNDPLRNIRLIPPGGMCGRSQEELDYFSYCATNRGGEGVCPVDEQCFDFEDVYWDRFQDDANTMNQPKAVFHPLYASTYQQYRAVRYMKWLRPEDSTVTSWNERTALDEQTFTTDERGLPIEYALAFSNLLNAHAYLNVPMAADDDYNRQFAQLVDQQLNSQLGFFLEYGNEIFNADQAVPYHYALAQANDDSTIPASDSDLIKTAKFAGKRSAEIFPLWRENLGNPERMTAVLTGFNPLAEFTLNVLDYNNAWQQADALAINGYIGPHRSYVDDQTAFDAMTLEDLFREIDDGSVLDSGASISDLNAMYQQHQFIASERGLKLIAYEGNNFMATEGGPSIVVNVFMNANRDRRMGDRFITNIQNFREAGGFEFFHFLNEDIWNDHGSFGMRQYQDQSREQAPVFDRLMEFVEDNNCWWASCLLTPP